MTTEDLKNHESTFDQPIKTCYRGVDVWEMPPSGQGITALIGLNILRGFDFSGMCASMAASLLLERLLFPFIFVS